MIVLQMTQTMNKAEGADDEFPTASKLGDDIRCAIAKGQVGRFFLVDVTGNPVLQYFVGAPKPMRQSSQHFQRNI